MRYGNIEVLGGKGDGKCREIYKVDFTPDSLSSSAQGTYAFPQLCPVTGCTAANNRECESRNLFPHWIAEMNGNGAGVACLRLDAGQLEGFGMDDTYISANACYTESVYFWRKFYAIRFAIMMSIPACCCMAVGRLRLFATSPPEQELPPWRRP